MPAKAVYDLEDAISQCREGWSLSVISSRPGMPPVSVLRRDMLAAGHAQVRARGKGRGYVLLSAAALSEMHRSREMTYREIAAELGCSPCSIYRFMKLFRLCRGSGVHRRSRGDRNHNWKGGRFKRNGYWYVCMPGHSMSGADGYLMEHRLVMSESLGRHLSSDEHVHHIDGDKQNNRPENLEIYTAKEHKREHFAVVKELLAVRKEVEQLRAEVNRLRGEDTYQRLRTYAG